MKKITLCALMFAGLASFAQHAVSTDLMQKGGLVPAQKPVNKFTNSIYGGQSTLATTTRYLNWQNYKTNYEVNVNGVPSNKFAYYLNPLFMDSTVLSSASTGNSTIFNMRAGVVLDPKSPYYDPTQSGVPQLTSTDSYRIDSLLIGGLYRKVTSTDDTLLVEICFADTLSSTVWQNLSIAGNNQIWRTPKLNCSASHGSVSFLSAPSNKKLVIKRVLTAADTVTVGNPFAGYVVISISGGLTIPAGNIAAATYTFIPGKSVAAGSVVYAYQGASSTQTENGFAGFLVGQGDLLPDFSNSAALFYDYEPSTFKRGYNSGVDYYTFGRYCKYATAQSFLNSCMLPSADFCWDVYFVVNANWPTAVIEKTQQAGLRVAQNIPNPCSDVTFVGYELTETANVKLEVYDVTGKKMFAVEEGKKMAGTYNMQVATNNLPAGAYIYTLTAGDARITKRMTVVK